MLYCQECLKVSIVLGLKEVIFVFETESRTHTTWAKFYKLSFVAELNADNLTKPGPVMSSQSLQGELSHLKVCHCVLRKTKGIGYKQKSAYNNSLWKLNRFACGQWVRFLFLNSLILLRIHRNRIHFQICANPHNLAQVIQVAEPTWCSG